MALAIASVMETSDLHNVIQLFCFLLYGSYGRCVGGAERVGRASAKTKPQANGLQKDFDEMNGLFFFLGISNEYC